jgi:hypothetical protein
MDLACQLLPEPVTINILLDTKPEYNANSSTTARPDGQRVDSIERGA